MTNQPFQSLADLLRKGARGIEANQCRNALSRTAECVGLPYALATPEAFADTVDGMQRTHCGRTTSWVEVCRRLKVSLQADWRSEGALLKDAYQRECDRLERLEAAALAEALE